MIRLTYEEAEKRFWVTVYDENKKFIEGKKPLTYSQVLKVLEEYEKKYPGYRVVNKIPKDKLSWLESDVNQKEFEKISNKIFDSLTYLRSMLHGKDLSPETRRVLKALEELIAALRAR